MKPVHTTERFDHSGPYHRRCSEMCSPEEVPSYPDAYIEHWYRLFHANRLYERHHVRFDTFLEHPYEILGAVIYGQAWPLPRGQEYYPLLPSQQAVMEGLEREELSALEAERAEAEFDAMPTAECRNGTWVIPLHHTAHPRKPARRFYS